MRAFFTYIHENIGRIVLPLCCVAIFAAVFALYGFPLEAVLYPTVLCAGFFLVRVIICSISQHKKHINLQRLTMLPDNLIDELNKYDEQIDTDYREIITELINRNAASASASAAKLSDIEEYYTTWLHQIKTPIAAMKLTLQNEDTAIARKLSDNLFRIEQYAEMAMCYLRLGSDSTDYLFKEHNLDQIVKDSIKRFAGQFIGKGVKLKYSESGKTVITDEKWLGFVIDQVISNAIKYTTSGYVSIYTESPLTLCIADTGCGIAPDDLPRIFERGYTGYNGRADKRASGLGLYLCKTICDRLGHTITAESNPGNGTIIKLDLSKTH